MKISGDATAKELRPRSRLIWLFVAFALFNFSLPPLMVWVDFLSFEKKIQLAIFLAGGVAGQCCFVVLLSALAHTTVTDACLQHLAQIAIDDLDIATRRSPSTA